MASPSKRKKPTGDEAEFGTEWAEHLSKLPETENQREVARELLRHRLKLQALPADNPYREGLADLTDADILDSIRDRANRARLNVEFDALVKLPDEGPTALAERWGQLANWGLRRFARRGSVDFTDELWVRSLADGIGDDGLAVASLPVGGAPLKLRWLAALQSATDALAAAARGLVKRKRLDAADLRDVRVLADLLVKVDEGGCVDLREAVSAVAIVAHELAAMPGKRGELTDAQLRILRAIPATMAQRPAKTQEVVVAKLAQDGAAVDKGTMSRAVDRFREMRPPLIQNDRVQRTRAGDERANAK